MAIEKIKSKLLDDFWSYLLVLAGGNVSGYVIGAFLSIPLWGKLLLFTLVLIVIAFSIYMIWPSLINRYRARRAAVYWDRLKKVIIRFDKHNRGINAGTESLTKAEVDRLRNEYRKLRIYLIDLTIVYQDRVLNFIKDAGNNERVASGSLHNFRSMFESETLEGWKEMASFGIKEMNRFDKYCIAIKTRKEKPR